MTTNNKINVLDKLDDPVIRREVAKESFKAFLHLYFTDYLKYDLAPMHHKMIDVCENQDISLGLIMAFRGSGKSTIVSTAYPLWSILGVQKKKLVAIFSKTHRQAKQMMLNIKQEAETNISLKNDLGPFEESSDEWGTEAIYFSDQKAKIMVLSIEQSVKGLRNGAHRPDLIILDDVEDNESVKVREQREKTYDKYKREILPLGDKGTKIIHVGNMLHKGSLINILKDEIKEGETDKVFYKFPILDENGEPMWKSKFPTVEDITKLENTINDQEAWQLEYMLQVTNSKRQIIRHEDIQYHTNLPAIVRKEGKGKYRTKRKLVIGVDLAISHENSADFTVIMPVILSEDTNGKYTYYVLKEFVRGRLNYDETLQEIVRLIKSLRVYDYSQVHIVVESNGFQAILSQSLKSLLDSHVKIESVHNLLPKETRLRSCSHEFINKKVFLPEGVGEIIEEELVGFGQEAHDDTVDALTIAMRYIKEKRLDENLIVCSNYNYDDLDSPGLNIRKFNLENFF